MLYFFVVVERSCLSQINSLLWNLCWACLAKLCTTVIKIKKAACRILFFCYEFIPLPLTSDGKRREQQHWALAIHPSSPIWPANFFVKWKRAAVNFCTKRRCHSCYWWQCWRSPSTFRCCQLCHVSPPDHWYHISEGRAAAPEEKPGTDVCWYGYG